MNRLPRLKPKDRVAVIAPASRCATQQLEDLVKLLRSWQLNCFVPADIFGDDLLCANSDAQRFQQLKAALFDPSIAAVICARGGYGSMRLIPALAALAPPPALKLFVGMSDITALHLYLQQHWRWPTLHAGLNTDRFSSDSINAVKALLFAEKETVVFTGLVPINQAAQQAQDINAAVTGGNLCLCQTSLGTAWQVKGENKIILLEEVGERGYRVDRMLEQLRQANVFVGAAAILFGDFLEGNEPDGSALIDPVLARFAASCKIPVLRLHGVGHGSVNLPLPLGAPATLQLGSDAKLIFIR